MAWTCGMTKRTASRVVTSSGRQGASSSTSRDNCSSTSNRTLVAGMVSLSLISVSSVRAHHDAGRDHYILCRMDDGACCAKNDLLVSIADVALVSSDWSDTERRRNGRFRTVSRCLLKSPAQAD